MYHNLWPLKSTAHSEVCINNGRIPFPTQLSKYSSLLYTGKFLTLFLTDNTFNKHNPVIKKIARVVENPSKESIEKLFQAEIGLTSFPGNDLYQSFANMLFSYLLCEFSSVLITAGLLRLLKSDLSVGDYDWYRYHDAFWDLDLVYGERGWESFLVGDLEFELPRLELL